MKKKFILSVFLILSSSAFAIDQKACSKLLNDGLWKKYKYGGIDQPLTQATKDHGISKSTSVTSTEGSTATLDPKYYSNITTSETQSTSSWGPCSAIGMNNVKENRVKYIAQNKDEILRDVARGQGEHLETLATLSLCESSTYKIFSSQFQKNFLTLMNLSANEIGDSIDNFVDSNNDLKIKCFSFKDII